MIPILRCLAAISVLASLIALGLSAMASDDMARSREAQALQWLVLLWLITSIATPFAAAAIARSSPAAQPFCYLPMMVLALISIARLLRF